MQFIFSIAAKMFILIPMPERGVQHMISSTIWLFVYIEKYIDRKMFFAKHHDVKMAGIFFWMINDFHALVHADDT